MQQCESTTVLTNHRGAPSLPPPDREIARSLAANRRSLSAEEIMKTRRLHLLSMFALVPCLALLGTACGTDDEKEEPTQDAGVDAPDGGDVAADMVADSGTSKDTAKPDTGPKDTGPPKDTAKPKTTCNATLKCLLGCGEFTGTCADNCNANVATGGGEKIKEITDCRANKCDKVKGEVAGVTCAIDKCLDKFSACIDLDTGSDNCLDIALCVGGCVLGDLGCTINCLVTGKNGSAAKASAMKICADGKCDGNDAVGMPGCVTDNCGESVKACASGTSFDCSQLANCVAHCPPSKKIEPNHCSIYCRGFAQEKALQALIEYETCKVGCNLVTNPVGCVIAKCSKEQNACYTDVGMTNCQKVYDCVVKDCQGVGGDSACIAKCAKQGNASAQDAFNNWEGCVLNNIDRDESILVGCEFPYDQITCVNYVSANFCGNQAAHCFTN